MAEEKKVAVITGGGMTKLMIYHGEHGWTFQPEL